MTLSDPPIFPDPLEQTPLPQQPEPEPEIIPSSEAAPAPWPAWSFFDVVALAILFVLILLASGFILGALAHLLPAFSHSSAQDLAQNTLLGVAIQAVAYLLWLVPICLVVCTKSREPLLQSIAWRWPRSGKLMFSVGIGLLITIAMIVVSKYIPVPDDAPFEQLFKTQRDAYAMAVFGVLFAPFFEEVFFRGLLYPVLRRHARYAFALLLTAACFGFLHAFEWDFAWGPVLMIFFVGLALTWVRERTQSVAASWIVHVVYNGSLLALSFVGTNGFTQPR